MVKYCRKIGSDTWHWCKNCNKYPSECHETSYRKPTSGELCNECKSKKENNNCSN